MKYFILIICFFLFNTIAKTSENNFFNEAKDLFDKEKYEDSKFLFQRNIVYNPKDSSSYLYLAKIFKIEEDQRQEEKNINTTLLLDPKNEEAMYLLIDIELERSNFSKADELSKDFKKICVEMCKKIGSIESRLKDFEKKMRLEDTLNKILIVDFGSQFTQLIARKIRELGIYCEIIKSQKNRKIKNFHKNIKGIVLSGGPLNVYENKKVKFNNNLLKLGIPVLGICFGHQIISKE